MWIHLAIVYTILILLVFFVYRRASKSKRKEHSPGGDYVSSITEHSFFNANAEYGDIHRQDSFDDISGDNTSDNDSFGGGDFGGGGGGADFSSSASGD